MSANGAYRFGLTLIIALCLSLTACQYFKQDASYGRVQAAGRMTTLRSGHTATLLADGTVLLAGGMERAEGDEVNTDTAELFDPHTNTCRPVSRMHTPRSGHTATLLPDGDVLIAGGFDHGVMLDTVELYHPASATFTLSAHMNARRSGHTATLLRDGRVLIAGGNYNLANVHNSTELYDSAQRSFTPAGPMTTPRVMHSATLLADGAVLLAGGSARFRSDVLASAELFNPATNTSSPTSSMRFRRTKHAALLLPNGQVLIAGGTDDASELTGAQTSAELYNPISHTFTLTGSMTAARFKNPLCAALLAGGQILVSGGSRYVEIYDPQAGRFTTANGRLDNAWLYPTTTPLTDGRVLITGGYNDSMQVTDGIWLYQRS